MVIEIKENLNTENIRTQNIVLLKRVSSVNEKLVNVDESISEYDYYKIIEKDISNFIVMCWNEGNDLHDVRVYIGKYEE